MQVVNHQPIHVDILPCSESTIENFNFCLISVDEFSSYLFLVMIKTKALNFFLMNAFSHES